MKYLILWELSNWALSSKDQSAKMGVLLSIIKNEIKKGSIADFGMFDGLLTGFLIFNNGGVPVSKFCNRFRPFINITDVKPFTSTDNLQDVL